MDTSRALEDAHRLQEAVAERGGALRVDWDIEEHREVRIEKYRFPPDWSPRRGDVVFDLRARYPRSPPMVYVQADLTYEDGQGKDPHVLYPPRSRSALDDIRDAPAEGGDPGELRRYCIHRTEISWDPDEDDLVSLLDVLEASLSQPRAEKLSN